MSSTENGIIFGNIGWYDFLLFPCGLPFSFCSSDTQQLVQFIFFADSLVHSQHFPLPLLLTGHQTYFITNDIVILISVASPRILVSRALHSKCIVSRKHILEHSLISLSGSLCRLFSPKAWNIFVVFSRLTVYDVIRRSRGSQLCCVEWHSYWYHGLHCASHLHWLRVQADVGWVWMGKQGKLDILTPACENAR